MCNSDLYIQCFQIFPVLLIVFARYSKGNYCKLPLVGETCLNFLCMSNIHAAKTGTTTYLHTIN